MKKIIFISFLLLGLSAVSNADYQDDISDIRTRVQAFAEGDAGLSDSERFQEIVKMTYDYAMLSYPDYAG